VRRAFCKRKTFSRSELIEQFLQKGSDANLKDDCNIPIITYAANMVRPDIIKMLIKSGANVNVIDEFHNQPPLLWLIKRFDEKENKEKIYESVQILIDGGADVNLNGKSEESTLISVVELEDEQLTKMLISAGANVNFKDDEDRTAYSYAAEIGNKDLRNILFQSGADISIGVEEYKKQYEENAFFQAAADGRTDVVEAMIATGTNVNATNSANATALMRTLKESTADALINAGADVNLKNNQGFTALIWATAFGRRNLVLKLVAAGADVNVKTFDGNTALDFANDEQIKSDLIEAGAKSKLSK
jgi:ankyrin repeat protein